jgi:hypothetical protein
MTIIPRLIIDELLDALIRNHVQTLDGAQVGKDAMLPTLLLQLRPLILSTGGRLGGHPPTTALNCPSRLSAAPTPG